ncbi:MAG: toxin HipA [Bacteroidetes bacterium RIFOXYA12_FULL_35_11]|nr:MAG: toxin HipA [Bacteroidetes bacterium GWF2_35_48]OFY79639.1 MAG: toxin HipA [Bacteroidetes bacterium RIFOXYA12_FULL_35_11]OFY95188.1 MAG: toxin HipA [Bacteroidetes bacterium RIFOXYC12_FULL_35_7]HBX49933.1 toxin HipA [Bacteroidales bacterium]
MAKGKFNIYVYADWIGLGGPTLMGVLSAHYGKGRKSFCFEYEPGWLKNKNRIVFDPDIEWYSGTQFPNNKENFGVFLDSMPDTWGRTLMKRRAALESNEKTGRKILYDTDYLLGVYDESRMGALRFKLEPNGNFLDHSKVFSIPPWANIRELQHAASVVESDNSLDDVRKWLAVLIAPGSSLGGARPKANIIDEKGNLWIAKFPSKNDIIDKAKWEFLAYLIALDAKVNMAESVIQKVSGKYSTFFTKRFDRIGSQRIHFASAMTMTGYSEDILREKDYMPSYLEIADFISTYGFNIDKNLHQLWRRIIFNIAVSNTDDHLRNHGFILKEKGWELSPAYDINPSTEKSGLALNIDMDSNELDYNLAFNVGKYFRLNKSEMEIIKEEVVSSVQKWKEIAKKLNISKSEINIMEAAFRIKLK